MGTLLETCRKQLVSSRQGATDAEQKIQEAEGDLVRIGGRFRKRKVKSKLRQPSRVADVPGALDLDAGAYPNSGSDSEKHGVRAALAALRGCQEGPESQATPIETVFSDSPAQRAHPAYSTSTAVASQSPDTATSKSADAWDELRLEDVYFTTQLSPDESPSRGNYALQLRVKPGHHQDIKVGGW